MHFTQSTKSMFLCGSKEKKEKKEAKRSKTMTQKTMQFR